MNNTTTTFIPGKLAVRILEGYTEMLCENLFINDTYYGNLLMCLTDLNEVLASLGFQKAVNLSYVTDFSKLIVTAKLSDNEKDIRQQTDKYLNDNINKFHLIETLSDKMILVDNSITLEFNISALHKSIYEDRLQNLKTYFNKVVITVDKP